MADTDQVLNLAAIIREVDGNHSKGAAALAESILDHPGFRVVLARWGRPAPAPPVEGEWQTGLPSFAGFYYVRGLLDESIGGDNRPVYVNPKHFVWGFWEQDDPEWIGLDSDITPDNIQWKPVAPLPSPVADGEVAELVEMLKGIAYWRLHGTDKPTLFDIRQAARLNRAAELLQRQVLVQVPDAERPWEREGWCDELGRCWWGRPDTGDWSADWTLATPEAIAEFCEFSPQTVCLPAHALPLPEVNV